MHEGVQRVSDIAEQPQNVEYEQPLTERMRIFLRLEFLYHQATFHAQRESDWDTRAAVASLLDMVTIMSRGDVRTEVLRELERQAELLRGFRDQPGVDVEQCDQLLASMERLSSELNSAPAASQALKQSPFLSAVQHRSAIPGGTCVFDLPEYTYWLSRPFEARQEQLSAWLELLRPLFASLGEVLWLVRNTSRPVEKVAGSGMYQEALDRNDPPILVRVIVSAGLPAYPEISGSQKRFTVRFLEWTGASERAQQTDQDVPFLLALC